MLANKRYAPIYLHLCHGTHLSVTTHKEGSDNIITTSTKKGAACTHLRNRKRAPISGHYRLVALRIKPRVATSAHGTKRDMLMHVA